MTLCVAAACNFKSRPAVVLGSDWQVENEVAKADIHDKLYWIMNLQWPVLIAGTVANAIRLKDTYHSVLKALPGGVHRENLIDVMHLPLRTFKAKLADARAGNLLGLSYEQVLAVGRAQLPEDMFREVMLDIARIQTDCELIVIPFIEGTPRIFKVSAAGVEPCEQFAVIGSGTNIADGYLSYREHDEQASLKKCLYHVYEAMKMGSKAPGVGAKFVMAVIYCQTKDSKTVAYNLSESYVSRLEATFRRLSPKKTRGIPDINPRNHLTPFGL